MRQWLCSLSPLLTVTPSISGGRNVTAIVLEVPSHLIGQARVHSWATASLYRHAPEVQVSRWGLPLITNLFIPEDEVHETYNRIGPAEDGAKIGPHLAP